MATFKDVSKKRWVGLAIYTVLIAQLCYSYIPVFVERCVGRVNEEPKEHNLYLHEGRSTQNPLQYIYCILLLQPYNEPILVTAFLLGMWLTGALITWKPNFFQGDGKALLGFSGLLTVASWLLYTTGLFVYDVCLWVF